MYSLYLPFTLALGRNDHHGAYAHRIQHDSANIIQI